MSFITDFLDYGFGQGTECHPNYIRWAAFVPLAIAAGRRYFFMQGRLIRMPELCICFIGPSGGKKTFAKDMAMNLVAEALPDIPTAADITTRDDLMRLMASKDTLRFYIDHTGAECEWHPIAIFLDEIRHFMSYSPSSMIAFLVAIYGRKRFIGSTIKRGMEDIIEPCLNLLSCTTEDWITEHLRTGVLAGGWSRRFIVVNEPDLSGQSIAIPMAHEDEAKIIHRLRLHLNKISTTAGQFQWGPGAKEYFIDWYNNNHKNLPSDQHMQSYFLTKDMHLCKIAMLLDLAEETPTLQVTKQNIGKALTLFQGIEANLPKLYIAAGRNELAVPQQRLLDLVNRSGGGMSRSDIMRLTDKDMSPMEQFSVVRHLIETKRLFPLNVCLDGNTTPVEMLVSPKRARTILDGNGKWDRRKRNGDENEKPDEPKGSSGGVS